MTGWKRKVSRHLDGEKLLRAIILTFLLVGLVACTATGHTAPVSSGFNAFTRADVASSQKDRPPEFPVRGIKGLWWDGIEKYRLALPWLAGHNLNFLMFCYTSFPASARDWRSDYTAEELGQMRELAAQAAKLKVYLCLSFNPAIWSKPPLEYSSESDYAILLRKVTSVHALGINWFALCLDDINRELTPQDAKRFKDLQSAQTHLVNRLANDMKRLKPRPKLIFCPSAYTTEDMQAHQDYIKAIGAGVDKDVQMFWTGPSVCSSTITAEDAVRVAQWLRRKPFVWDNYPVNDMFPWRPLLAPVRGRSADLGGAVSGFMANPMKQFHASTLPLATLAFYLNSPEQYDPARARELLVASYPPADRKAISLLLDLYGHAFWGDAEFPPKPRAASRAEAGQLLGRYRALRKELQARPSIAPLLDDITATLDADIHALERQAALSGSDTGPDIAGDRFTGGGGEVFGFSYEDRWVNYVYAAPTGKSEMSAAFTLRAPPAAPHLRLLARNDDAGTNPRIQIRINGITIYEGASDFGLQFSERVYPIPASALQAGENKITIANLQPEGALGMPPWFMVARAEIVSPEE